MKAGLGGVNKGEARKPRLGLHLPVAKGLGHTVIQASFLGLECLQIFSGNPRGWVHKELDPAEAAAFCAGARAAGLDPVVLHAPYLVNLASPDKEIWGKSLAMMQSQMTRAQSLGCRAVVVHAGSRNTRPLAWGLARVAEAVKRLFDRQGGEVALWLENTAGGGGHLGGTLAQLSELLALLQGLPVGLCLDTAHLWGSGYPLARPAGRQKMMQRIDTLIGFENLGLWHFNDSVAKRGSKRDQHTHLGKGEIGGRAFASLMGHPAFCGAAIVMETPKDSAWADRRNLAYLRRLRSKGANC